MKNLSREKCLLDTNILVALLNRKHINHLKALSLYDRLIKGEFKAVISSQNLFELTAVLVHGIRGLRKEVANDVEILSQDKLLEVVYPDFRVWEKFIELLKSENQLHLADLYLLATAQVFEVKVIISADKEFTRLIESAIIIYNPFI